MRIAALLFLAAFTAVGCKEITFRTPQPNNKRALSSIPLRLQGRYVPEGELDTIVITSSGYQLIPADTSDEAESGTLGDSLVLKRYKGYFFFNLRNANGWTLAVIERERTGDIRIMTMDPPDGEGFGDYVTRISARVTVDSLQTDNGMLYYIDPSPAELVSLLQDGFFRASSPLMKVRP